MPNPHYCSLLTPVLDHYHVCIQSGRYSEHCVVTTRHCYKDSPATDLGPIYTICTIVSIDLKQSRHCSRNLIS